MDDVFVFVDVITDGSVVIMSTEVLALNEKFSHELSD
jgi:hypothetical protein